MGHKSKRNREIAEMFSSEQRYTLDQAIAILQKCPAPKFDQSVDVSMRLGVDPRKADQQVRGTVSLPNGTGKTLVVLVLTKGEKIQEAMDAGADYAGNEEYIDKINSGWMEFDAVVATPDMMREVGKLGKILGPRGLMPTPKAGTVTTDVSKIVQDLKAGMIEFKVDRHAVINNAVGKLSFEAAKLLENIKAFIGAIARAKPSASKGHFVKSLILSSTMGPGLKIDLREMEGI